MVVSTWSRRRHTDSTTWFWLGVLSDEANPSAGEGAVGGGSIAATPLIVCRREALLRLPFRAGPTDTRSA